MSYNFLKDGVPKQKNHSVTPANFLLPTPAQHGGMPDFSGQTGTWQGVV
jgi:hypothetical protein